MFCIHPRKCLIYTPSSSVGGKQCTLSRENRYNYRFRHPNFALQRGHGRANRYSDRVYEGIPGAVKESDGNYKQVLYYNTVSCLQTAFNMQKSWTLRSTCPRILKKCISHEHYIGPQNILCTALNRRSFMKHAFSPVAISLFNM